MNRARLTFTVLLIPICIFASNAILAQPPLVAICEAASVNGTRTSFVPEQGYVIEDDRVTWQATIFVFDAPEKGVVRITVGNNEAFGYVLNDREDLGYKTVTYVYSGVGYMATLFLRSGKLFTSEHKDSFNIPVATVWRQDCTIQE